MELFCSQMACCELRSVCICAETWLLIETGSWALRGQPLDCEACVAFFLGVCLGPGIFCVPKIWN